MLGDGVRQQLHLADSPEMILEVFMGGAWLNTRSH